MITENELKDQQWRFSRSSGEVIAESITFEDSGKLSGNVLTEERWSLDKEDLRLFIPDGTVTTHFRRIQVTSGAKMRLVGRFEPDPDLKLYHFLDPADSGAPMKESRLNLTMSLSLESDTILVIVNSAGRPSEGSDTRWEFYDLPTKLGVDHVRVGETSSPKVYYLDKIQTLTVLLTSVLKERYQKVLLTGMSSGGYLSLLLAEVLSVRFPKISFHSFVINPQTTYGVRHSDFISQYVPLGEAAEVLDAQSLAMSDLEDTEIEIIATGNRHRDQQVHHTVYYDSLNMSECYHCSLIGDLPNFDMKPIPVGLPHAQGCIEIFDSGVLQEAITYLIRKGY